jgi:hypothetical protein
MRLLWLTEVLRAAALTVHEVDGWRTRGSSTFDPRGIMCHETRGSRQSTDAGEIRVLLEGSATAPAPIAQLYLSRTGHWHVVASGRCHHALIGWAGPFEGVGNTGLVGIEAQHALGEPWTQTQYRSYVRGVAAIRRHTGWGIVGHKEHQPGGYGHPSVKTDPSFNMDQFRGDVAAQLAGEGNIMPALTDEEQHDLYARVKSLSWQVGRGALKQGNAGDKEPLLWWTGHVNQFMAEVRGRLDALAAATGDEAVLAELARIRTEASAAAAGLHEAVDEVDEAVLAALGVADLDQAAAALRAAFGDARAAELGARLISQG